MIFGRKHKAARAIEDDVELDETPTDADDGTDADPIEGADESGDEIDSQEDLDDAPAAEDDTEREAGDDADGGEERDIDEDENEDDEESVDYRDDGPFDFDEVDLDADDVERIDFGALIITPFEGMELQLQVEEQTQQIQSALVVHEGSAIEVTLFAAPTNGGLAKEVLAELVEVTNDGGGQADVEEGPFGPELFRVVTIDTPEAKGLLHRSRIWLVEGPRWMLRAVLMGNAVEPGPGRELLEDFFRNLVVVRGGEPKARGDLIPLTMPKNLVENR